MILTPRLAPYRPGTDGLQPTALAGVRVVDFSRVLAGPFATQVLGDLGAEIVKIEQIRTGDEERIASLAKMGAIQVLKTEGSGAQLQDVVT